MKVTINVTQEDIDQGLPSISDRCPIALACKRVSPLDNERVVVRKYSIDKSVAHHKDGFQSFDRVASLPPEARLFITKFDDNVKVAPFSFEVELNDN